MVRCRETYAGDRCLLKSGHDGLHKMHEDKPIVPMKSNAYKLVIGDEIVAEGKLKEMRWLRKKLGGHVYFTMKPVGSKITGIETIVPSNGGPTSNA